MPASTTASEPEPAQGDRGGGAPEEDARVDRVADDAVRAAGHELRLVLLRHRSPPVAPDVDARPDRESQAEEEEDEPDAGAQRIGVARRVRETLRGGQTITTTNEHRPDPQLARPRRSRPRFIEKAATSQYSQNAAQPTAKTSSTARIVSQYFQNVTLDKLRPICSLIGIRCVQAARGAGSNRRGVCGSAFSAWSSLWWGCLRSPGRGGGGLPVRRPAGSSPAKMTAWYSSFRHPDPHQHRLGADGVGVALPDRFVAAVRECVAEAEQVDGRSCRPRHARGTLFVADGCARSARVGHPDEERRTYHHEVYRA